MKHYIWLSLLLAFGVVQAEDKPEEAKEEVAAPAEEQGGESKEEVAAPVEEQAGEAKEEAVLAEDAAALGAEQAVEESSGTKKSKKSKKSKTKKIRKRKKGSKSKSHKKGRKYSKGGHKAHSPSPSVMNAYMNRVQNGEMCSAAPAASMSVMPSDQGGCATGNCALPVPDAIAEVAA
ncbi:MAG: hypothetical protein FJX00_00625 [Alphaproteobacteria bacterium]|nr:hypothetical protein [Alphaproteobacteria bacterium]